MVHALQQTARWRMVAATMMLGAGAVLLAQGDASNQEFVGHYLGSRPTSLAGFRRLEAVPRITGGRPVMLLVNDFIQNEWATHFLRKLPMRMASYRNVHGGRLSGDGTSTPDAVGGHPLHRCG